MKDPPVNGTWDVTCPSRRKSGGRGNAFCDRLEGRTAPGIDLFAPVPADALCSAEYDRPATATVAGRWKGRRVDARFDRTNGCETARWGRLRPLLPPAH
ncbi:hypothetical protein C6N75_06740 [Streptomyces solincola]|uniref:Subtilisin inhibitor domain-containing protein n=1 Tax=Streptomyces solincola TaxID=2100817 RepID=A0A2S9PZW5_9ACTN|nr:hypothetical protein [Streptomyces solincola]PRH79970.1 hypothetical protein C6N75_06740 [Streptomyces solincola]